METIPSWVLTIVYWLHLMATVIWVGGVFSLAIFFLPVLRTVEDELQKYKLLLKIQKRFQPAGWLALIILSATGLVQMSVHPFYEGFLKIDNSWSVAIFTKHIAVALLVILMAIMTWVVLPVLNQINLRQSLGKSMPESQKIKYDRYERYIITANVIMSLIVLFLTAWARSVS